MMPAHEIYLEPFAGGSAVLFAKPPAARETINDLDQTVMRFWRVLRERPQELAAAVALTPYSRAEWEACRDLDVEDDVEAARRLLVKFDQSFSRTALSWSPPSLLRDRGGRWQPGTWANMPSKLLGAAARLSNVCIECGDALAMIPRWDLPGSLIYCDPPYVGEHRLDAGRFRYTPDAEGDLWPRLVDVLAGLEHAAVLLSGYPCEEAEGLGWRSIELRARKNVQARKGSKLPLVPETVWLSHTMPEQVPSLFDTLEPANRGDRPPLDPPLAPIGETF
jgi:DNA adenine methylase